VRSLALARHGRAFPSVLGGLIGLAWLALWIWEASPYGRYLDHGQWTESGLAAGLCRAVPAGEILIPGLLYAAGWVLMSAAMMLPTTLPLLDIFHRLTAGRADRNRLLAALIAGYLAVWGAFGIAVHLLDRLLHAAVQAIPWLAFNGWVPGAAVLALAGAFQFSTLKYHCLDECRTPLSFVMQHWRGRAETRRAFLLGAHHGLFCVGCCWAIMLLIFVVGTGSLGWMLALAAVMAIEKNLPWGRRLAAPLGVVLLAWSGAILVENARLWPG
jgi:predicted metal-binding membrane protein